MSPFFANQLSYLLININAGPMPKNRVHINFLVLISCPKTYNHRQATVKYLLFVMYQSKDPITARDSAMATLQNGEKIFSPENIIFWSKEQVPSLEQICLNTLTNNLSMWIIHFYAW